MAPFYGAPPMALLTVGAGALLVGRDLVGLAAAVRIDEILWTLGTITGLLSTIAIPYLAFTEYQLAFEDMFATWLMPVVPPMVSAATGAALIAHLPAGQARLTMLLACYGMFGVSLFISLITITLLWGRLAFHGLGPARTRSPRCGSCSARSVSPSPPPACSATPRLVSSSAPYARVLHATGVVYGVPVWGFAIIWLAIAAAITIRDRPGAPSLLADLVELHLPGRHGRHRHLGVGARHPRGLPPLCERRAVRAPAHRRLAHRRHPDHPRRPQRPVPPPAAAPAAVHPAG